MRNYCIYESPIGKLYLSSSEGYLVGLDFKKSPLEEIQQEDEVLKKAVSQLEEYFLGQRKEFTLPLNPQGTPFQKQVWEALRTIPYGETRSYKEVAIAIGNPKACRAVGMANNKNPIAIITPCHRVVGANGKMVGYAGGLGIKEALLEVESKADK